MHIQASEQRSADESEDQQAESEGRFSDADDTQEFADDTPEFTEYIDPKVQRYNFFYYG